MFSKEAVSKISTTKICKWNTALIKDAYHSVVLDPSNHVDVSYQIIVDHITKKNIAFEYIHSNETIAYNSTKNLKNIIFVEFMKLTVMLRTW